MRRHAAASASCCTIVSHIILQSDCSHHPNIHQYEIGAAGRRHAAAAFCCCTIVSHITGAVDKPCAPFKVPISPTKKPETPSSLVSNESSSSLLSRDVPGYEILTQIVRDMQENVTVMKMLQSHYSNKNESWLIHFNCNFLNNFYMKWLFSCAHMKAESLWISKLSLL